MVGKEERNEHKLLRLRNISLQLPKCRNIEEHEEVKIPQITKIRQEQESKERQDRSKSMMDNSIDYSDVLIKDLGIKADPKNAVLNYNQEPQSNKDIF